MTDAELSNARREQIFRDFALILQKANPEHIHFYVGKGGAEDRIYDGVIREGLDEYKLAYAPILNLGRLYSSLDVAGQRDLIGMAAHQARRDSALCRYTPQILVFLAKYFSFRGAAVTVLEYLKLDELGWYTLHAMSDVLGHDHVLASDGDLEVISAKLLDRLRLLNDKTYEEQARLQYHEGGFGPDHVAYWRAKKTAQKVIKQIREVRHMRLVRGLSDSPLLTKPLSGSAFKTEDAILNELLESARVKFLSDDQNLRKEALEKLWDAWERLKTLEPGKDKKDSIRILLDKSAPDPSFRETLEDEATQLTAIGNSYMIRHSEIGKIPIASPEQTNYLFYRMFSLIRFLLRSTARGG
jgi:hypothetical protein